MTRFVDGALATRAQPCRANRHGHAIPTGMPRNQVRLSATVPCQPACAHAPSPHTPESRPLPIDGTLPKAQIEKTRPRKAPFSLLSY